MHVNINIPNPEVFQAEVVLGEKFSFGSDLKGAHWFTEVNGGLRITQAEARANLEARAPGKAEVLLFDGSFSLVRKLDITVIPGSL